MHTRSRSRSSLRSACSPFSKLEKLLLLSSYFVLFEYTVISRDYGIGFLFALIYADMRARRPDRIFLNALLLGLLANTNLFAFLLSGALALEYVTDLLLNRRKPFVPPSSRCCRRPSFYLAFFTLAVCTMWPSPDISWRSTGEPLRDAGDMVRLWALVAGNVEAPVPTHPLQYWYRSAGGRSPDVRPSCCRRSRLPSSFFRSHPRLLIVPGLTAVASITVGQLVYSNAMRHWGVNFVAFIATLWIDSVGAHALRFRRRHPRR